MGLSLSLLGHWHLQIMIISYLKPCNCFQREKQQQQQQQLTLSNSRVYMVFFYLLWCSFVFLQFGPWEFVVLLVGWLGFMAYQPL